MPVERERPTVEDEQREQGIPHRLGDERQDGYFGHRGKQEGVQGNVVGRRELDQAVVEIDGGHGDGYVGRPREN